MTTLTLKLKNKKDATLIFDFAKKSNIEMQIVEKSNGLGKPAVKKPILSAKEKNKSIMEISKSINKIGTQKAFKKLGLDYDSYCR